MELKRLGVARTAAKATNPQVSGSTADPQVSGDVASHKTLGSEANPQVPGNAASHKTPGGASKVTASTATKVAASPMASAATKATASAATRPLAVRLQGFAFAYPGGKQPVIGPLTWELRQQEFCLLEGCTGGGKTTMLRCLHPTLTPVGQKQGSVQLFGQPAALLDKAQFAQTVSYVAQNPQTQLVCDSVWHELAFGLENLGVSRDDMRVRVAEVAHFFGIEQWFYQRVESLSGGQKQLLALASTLVMRPQLLLLDEPTAQLDPVAAKNFLHALFRVNKELGITVLVATHAPEDMVEYATSAARLESGQLYACDVQQFAAKPFIFPTGVAAAVAFAAQPHASSASQSAVGASATNSDTASVSQPAVGLASASPNAANASQPAAGSAAANPSAPHPAAAHSTAAALVLDDAYVRYERKAAWVLRGCDLCVQPGTIHALLGGNGCGKSTLLQALAGTLKVERGACRNTLQRQQAYLPQSPQALFVCDSVQEELQEWLQTGTYTQQDIDAALVSFGLAPCAQQHPYDLSGGQQQLLALAKLLLIKPKLLLLDEPTKGLDARMKCLVAQVLQQEKQRGTTMVMATHDLEFAALLANRVTLLFDGQAAATQSSEAFFRGNMFFRPRQNAFVKAWALRQASQQGSKQGSQRASQQGSKQTHTQSVQATQGKTKPPTGNRGIV